MTIDKVNVPSLLEGFEETFLSDREKTFILASAPPVKVAANLEYGYKQFTIGTRLNYFGEITLLGYGEDGLGINPMVPLDNGNGYVADQYVYSGKLSVPDVYASWKFNNNFTFNLGVDNFLNIHPDLAYAPGAAGWAFNNETGGPWDAGRQRNEVVYEANGALLGFSALTGMLPRQDQQDQQDLQDVILLCKSCCLALATLLLAFSRSTQFEYDR